jgi:hypothetical protein
LHDGHQSRGDVLLGLDSDRRFQQVAHGHVIRLQILFWPAKTFKK